MEVQLGKGPTDSAIGKGSRYDQRTWPRARLRVCVLERGRPRAEGITLSISFIVRTFNSMATIEACVSSIRAQNLDQELIIVDSGSIDGTREYAEVVADQYVSMPRADFSYGKSLNLGMMAATNAVCALLSSHCTIPRSNYADVAVSLHTNERVAATNGARYDAIGREIAGTHFETKWIGGLGFSHHSATVSRKVWEQFPYNERLGASEDKEWARRVLASGNRVIAFDPRLYVDNRHRRAQGIKALHRRGLREAEAEALLSPELAESPFWNFLRAWATDLPSPRRYPYPGYLVHPKRIVELYGRYQGFRNVARGRGVD